MRVLKVKEKSVTTENDSSGNHLKLKVIMNQTITKNHSLGISADTWPIL